MHWLKLPKPQTRTAPAFTDPLNAKIWLAGLPPNQPLQNLSALTQQIAAVDGSTLPPAKAVELLDLLRTAAIPHQAAVEMHFQRKALPMAEGDRRVFEIAEFLWQTLAIAYLRKAMELPAEEQAAPLQKAATAQRLNQYCHYQAAHEVTPLSVHVLFAILGQAQSSDTLLQPVADSDYPHFGVSHIAGHLTWAFLLLLIDPYQLSPAQLIVANRALSRWRELSEFRTSPSPDPQGYSLDLTPLFVPPPFPSGLLRWLEIRKIGNKITSRINSLQKGETPESLKLGRELSGAACIRLLHLIDSNLQAQYRPTATEVGEIELAFGTEHAYVVFKGENLTNVERFNPTNSQVTNQRLGLFGFDQISHVPDSVKKLAVPSETWHLVDGRAVRKRDTVGERRQSPCLIVSKRKDKLSLGVMRGLRVCEDGALTSELEWFYERIEVGFFNAKGSSQDATRHPVFLLRDGDEMSLIAPAHAVVRVNEALFLSGIAIGKVIIGGVIERGADFVHYSVRNR